MPTTRRVSKARRLRLDLLKRKQGGAAVWLWRKWQTRRYRCTEMSLYLATITSALPRIRRASFSPRVPNQRVYMFARAGSGVLYTPTLALIRSRDSDFGYRYQRSRRAATRAPEKTKLTEAYRQLLEELVPGDAEAAHRPA